ncbi:uncharacterized protein LOC144157647 [Haemaphysalis longicornis]
MGLPNLSICVALPWLYYCTPNPAATKPPDINVPTDGFKAMSKLPVLVAAYVSTDCPTFLCLDANRTSYDPSAKQLSYTWYFAGLNGTRKKSTRLDIHYGDLLDKPWYYIDGDSCHNYTSMVAYSDYSTCLVGVIPFPPDNLCVLWTKPSLANTIPKKCMDAFHDTCGQGHLTYGNNLCSGS